MTAQAFDELVAEALDEIPAELAQLLDNVVVLIEQNPGRGRPAGLLGLYEGIPLTRRTTSYAGVLPDRITIFRGPVLRTCSTWAEAVEQVRITVVHEIAHHFGIDDAQLEAWGYG
jgi:predicted Zn-dependent protease with MMP-like domain